MATRRVNFSVVQCNSATFRRAFRGPALPVARCSPRLSIGRTRHHSSGRPRWSRARPMHRPDRRRAPLRPARQSGCTPRGSGRCGPAGRRPRLRSLRTPCGWRRAMWRVWPTLVRPSRRPVAWARRWRPSTEPPPWPPATRRSITTGAMRCWRPGGRPMPRRRRRARPPWRRPTRGSSMPGAWRSIAPAAWTLRQRASERPSPSIPGIPRRGRRWRCPSRPRGMRPARSRCCASRRCAPAG